MDAGREASCGVRADAHRSMETWSSHQKKDRVCGDLLIAHPARNESPVCDRPWQILLTLLAPMLSVTWANANLWIALSKG
jgi:hypothetical protein